MIHEKSENIFKSPVALYLIFFNDASFIRRKEQEFNETITAQK